MSRDDSSHGEWGPPTSINNQKFPTDMPTGPSDQQLPNHVDNLNRLGQCPLFDFNALAIPPLGTNLKATHYDTLTSHRDNQAEQ